MRPPPDGDVFVCENPRVLEAAVDAGRRRAVVCTQGQPAVVVTALLSSLGAAGAELRYHGDFDWPGITIANALIGSYGCRAVAVRRRRLPRRPRPPRTRRG